MSLYNSTPDKFSNVGLNSVGSKYSVDFNHDTSLLIEKITNKAIFDSAPQQFMDLKLLNMKSAVPVNSDEFFYQEMGYQREPIVASGVAGSVSYPNTQIIPVVSTDNIATNTIITYPNGQKASVAQTTTINKK